MNFAASATTTNRTSTAIVGYRRQIATLESSLAASRAATDALNREKRTVEADLRNALERVKALAAQVEELSGSKLTAKGVIAEISREHDVPVPLILGHRRSVHIVNARHHAMYEVARRCSWMSYPEIGKLFNRDHSSCLYAITEWPKRAAGLGIPFEAITGRATLSDFGKKPADPAKLGIHVHPLGRERSGE